MAGGMDIRQQSNVQPRPCVMVKSRIAQVHSETMMALPIQLKPCSADTSFCSKDSDAALMTISSSKHEHTHNGQAEQLFQRSIFSTLFTIMHSLAK
jgi:hypothetical protein